MILVIDNYDSFTWNLVHYLMELGQEVSVVRNDALTVSDAMASNAEAFLISPGPCTPRTRICSMSAVRLGPVMNTSADVTSAGNGTRTNNSSRFTRIRLAGITSGQIANRCRKSPGGENQFLPSAISASLRRDKLVFPAIARNRR